jgi:hypothetical protein
VQGFSIRIRAGAVLLLAALAFFCLASIGIAAETTPTPVYLTDDARIALASEIASALAAQPIRISIPATQSIAVSSIPSVAISAMPSISLESSATTQTVSIAAITDRGLLAALGLFAISTGVGLAVAWRLIA